MFVYHSHGTPCSVDAYLPLTSKLQSNCRCPQGSCAAHKFGWWVRNAHYCGMYILLSDDKHRKVRDSSKNALEIRDKFSPRQNAVQDKIQSENFFPTVGKIFSD